MISPTAESGTAIKLAVESVSAPRAEERTSLPQGLIDWLVNLRLLEGVPFNYIVPHADMLPLESIRFFYLNRNWLDAAVDGALSLGAATTRERTHIETLYTDVRAALDEGERQVWEARTGSDLSAGDAEVVTGFLMRSRVVAGWPALHVRAFRGEGEAQPLRLLRMERLAPAVLLVLVDGVPDTVYVEEPKAAAQFGVDPDDGGRSLAVRDPATGEAIEGRAVAVPFRAGAPGVIDMTALRAKLVAEAGDVVGPTLSSAELSLQLLQYPYRQIFGKTDAPGSAVFKPTISIEVVRSSDGR